MSLKTTLLALLPSAPKTPEELRQVASEAASTIYEIDTLVAERDAVVEAAKSPYDSRIILAEKQRDSLVDKLKAWALGHRDAFGGKKTYPIAGHRLAFRVSPGKLEHTGKEADLVDRIVGSGDGELLEVAITVKPALDKASIKAALESGNEEIVAKLSGLGFRIEKPETFSFNPAHVDS